MAGRATLKTATGYASNSTIQTLQLSGKDLRGHTKLKFRQIGQASVTELRQRDFKEELDKKEQKYSLENDKTTAWMAKEDERPALLTNAAAAPAPLLLTMEPQPQVEIAAAQKYDDADVEEEDSSRGSNGSDDGFDSSSSEEESDDDDDDDEAQLQAELERIREERAAAQAKKLREDQELEEKLRKDSALKSNPLVDLGDETAKIKRRWNDDVVFRNQTRDEPEQKKRFINDTIRSDFHRSFLKKFVH